MHAAIIGISHHWRFATRWQIRFDEAPHEAKPFVVTRAKCLWRISSHNVTAGYEQLGSEAVIGEGRLKRDAVVVHLALDLRIENMCAVLQPPASLLVIAKK